MKTLLTNQSGMWIFGRLIWQNYSIHIRWHGIFKMTVELGFQPEAFHFPDDRNQAFEVFQGLKQEDRLEVQYLRRGHRRSLTYRIIPRGSAVQPNDKAKSPSSAPAEPAKQDAEAKPPAAGVKSSAKTPATQHT